MKDFEITYIEKNGYFYPDLKLPKQTDYVIGKYGLLHLDYLKKHKKTTYTSLMMSGKLNEYLHEIDLQAHEMLKDIISQRKAQLGVDEDLKDHNQMKWVRVMNQIKNEAEYFIYREVIYR